MFCNSDQRCVLLTPIALLLVATAGAFSAASVQAEPAPTSTLKTRFACVNTGKNFATIAQRGNRHTPPMILWTQTQGGLSPQQRCNTVTGNLNRAVSSSGVRRLSSLSLTYGTVNNNQSICFVTPRDQEKRCTDKNLIMTLRPDDNPTDILQQIRNFSTTATGNPVQRGQQNNEIYDLGLAIDKLLSQPETTASPAPKPAATTAL